jgi:hypothetical protein
LIQHAERLAARGFAECRRETLVLASRWRPSGLMFAEAEN